MARSWTSSEISRAFIWASEALARAVPSCMSPPLCLKMSRSSKALVTAPAPAPRLEAFADFRGDNRSAVRGLMRLFSVLVEVSTGALERPAQNASPMAPRTPTIIPTGSRLTMLGVFTSPRAMERPEWLSEVRGQRTEDRGQRSEDRGQRTEVRGQRSEVRGQRSEVGGRRSEVGARRFFSVPRATVARARPGCDGLAGSQ